MTFAAKSLPERAHIPELQPLNPEQPDGPRIKVLNGDMKTGPWSGIALLPGGRPAGKRTHGSDYGAAVISGTASGDDVEFGAGSIWREKAGSVHATGCASAAATTVGSGRFLMR